MKLPAKLPAMLKRDLHNGWRMHRKLDVMGHIEGGLTLTEGRIGWAFVEWIGEQDPQPLTGLAHIDDTYAAFRTAMGGKLEEWT